jgi:PKD repeat protein
MKAALLYRLTLIFLSILFLNFLLIEDVKSQSILGNSDQPKSDSIYHNKPINLTGLSRHGVENYIAENYDYAEILLRVSITKQYQNNDAIQGFVFPVISAFYDGIFDGVARGILKNSNQVNKQYNALISSLKEELITRVFPENEPFTPKSFNGPCINMDFEDGDLSGWTLIKGNVDGSVPYSFTGGVLSAPGASHLIVSGTGNDPVIPSIPLVNPLSGSFSCRLGDGTATQKGAARMSQTFLVTPSNSILTYSYAVVFEDPNHTLNQQPYFTVRVYDELGGIIPCGSYSVIAGNNATASGFSQMGNVLYKNWTTVFSPLNAYIGQNVTVEFTTGDCTLSGHYGYAYIDASCNTFDITTSTGNTIICDGDSITLYAPQGGASYLWSTGATTSSINTNQPGNYTVDVIPFQGSLCAISIDIDIVAVPVPVANFDFVPVCLGQQMDFSDLSIINNTSTIISWNWNFGGGNSSTQLNPSFTFANSGNQVVSLIVNSPQGCSDTISRTVNVLPLPNVSFSVPSICDGSTSVYTNTSTIASPSVLSSFSWDVENNGTIDYTTEHISHQFSHGSYSTKLVAVSDFGCRDSIIQSVLVYPVPLANFSQVPVCLNESTVFQDLSALVGSGNISTWNWNFGDGTSSATQNPSHIFSSAGNYIATLEVTSNNGCSHSVTIPTTINPLPVADFQFVNACFNTAIQFTEIASSNRTVQSIIGILETVLVLTSQIHLINIHQQEIFR